MRDLQAIIQLHTFFTLTKTYQPDWYNLTAKESIMKVIKKSPITSTLSVVALALASSSTMAQDLSITVTNLTQGLYFTPVITAAHTSENHIFMSGTSASDELQAMAEGGSISGLSSILTNADANINENPAAGLLAPAMSASFDLTNDSTNTHLSLAAMVLPSNDGFVGLDSWKIPEEAGTLLLGKARLRRRLKNEYDPENVVQIYRPFWPEQYLPDARPGLAHPILVYADLIHTGDVRNRETAGKLYEQYIIGYLKED